MYNEAEGGFYFAKGWIKSMVEHPANTIEETHNNLKRLYERMEETAKNHESKVK